MAKCEECEKKFKFREKRHYMDIGGHEKLLCKECYKKSEEQFFSEVKPRVPYKPIKIGNIITFNEETTEYSALTTKRSDVDTLSYTVISGRVLTEEELSKQSDYYFEKHEFKLDDDPVAKKITDDSEMERFIEDVVLALRWEYYPLVFYVCEDKNFAYTVESSNQNLDKISNELHVVDGKKKEQAEISKILSQYGNKKIPNDIYECLKEHIDTFQSFAEFDEEFVKRFGKIKKSWREPDFEVVKRLVKNKFLYRHKVDDIVIEYFTSLSYTKDSTTYEFGNRISHPVLITMSTFRTTTEQN